MNELVNQLNEKLNEVNDLVKKIKDEVEEKKLWLYNNSNETNIMYERIYKFKLLIGKLFKYHRIRANEKQTWMEFYEKLGISGYTEEKTSLMNMRTRIRVELLIYRTDNKLTKKQMAEKLGIRLSKYIKLEEGNLYPTISLLNHISYRLDGFFEVIFNLHKIEEGEE